MGMIDMRKKKNQLSIAMIPENEGDIVKKYAEGESSKFSKILVFFVAAMLIILSMCPCNTFNDDPFLYVCWSDFKILDSAPIFVPCDNWIKINCSVNYEIFASGPLFWGNCWGGKWSQQHYYAELYDDDDFGDDLIAQNIVHLPYGVKVGDKGTCSFIIPIKCNCEDCKIRGSLGSSGESEAELFFNFKELTVGGSATKKAQCICGKEVSVDPPICKNIMVFPTAEHFHGSDLNCDGDTNDTVLRYQNLETGKVVNTGLIASGTHHAIDIYENIVAFVGEDSHICCYDINTGTVRRIGTTGSHPSIYGNIIAFSSKGTVHYFDLNTQTLVNTEVTGYNPVIYQNVIVFHAPTPKHTIWVYNLRTGESVNTGAIGKNPTIYENIIAFETLEFSTAGDLNGDGDAHDMVIRFYDLETQTITNTGAVGFYPAIYGSRIVFATRECDICQDLNGDDKILGEIIRYYDLETGLLINTGRLGTQPDIHGNTITSLRTLLGMPADWATESGLFSGPPKTTPLTSTLSI